MALTPLPEWESLQTHYQEIKTQKMRDWFIQDPQRFSRFSLRSGEILFDYSKNRITSETLKGLIKLARAVNLPAKIRALFSAETVNTTEDRAALHIALRNKAKTPLIINQQDVMPLVQDTLTKMRLFVESIHDGTWRGSTGKMITHIVNIGIGGSHLGPLMATYALSSYAKNTLRFHFISDVDGHAIQQVLNQLDPERTLFIISSKSFTTIETLMNARSVYKWLKGELGVEESLTSHFIAVTAQKEKAKEFGILEENIFPIWEWVGGRYSVWSAIGLPLALQIGMDRFLEFLEGAYQADHHFSTTDFSQNIPVMMGLLSIWYINFFGATTQAIIPYSHRLKHFRAYLQQLDMESNGKCVTHQGTETFYSTGPIIWGELGIHGQHAFHQLLHQGTHLVPVDFLLVGQDDRAFSSHQDLLIANALSQAQALMSGKKAEVFEQEWLNQKQSSEPARLAKHREIPGNKPSNLFFIDKMTPKNLGTLIAFYEHKTFVQSVIWDINPFDQWGVELGKTLLTSVLEDIHQDTVVHHHDSSTEGLIMHYKKLKESL